MVEKPILFSGPMVRAILAGQKTQTRRVVTPQPPEGTTAVHCLSIDQDLFYNAVFVREHDWGGQEFVGHPEQNKSYGCPYGAPGDRLWVREAFKHLGFSHACHVTGYLAQIQYAADEAVAEYRLLNGDTNPRAYTEGWRPSIHMPRWASRLTLGVVGVRVERVQDITGPDARAEGVVCPFTATTQDGQDHLDRSTFADLWNSINGPRGFGWDANPFVWVVDFAVVPSPHSGAGSGGADGDADV